jgi:two-component system sensor histidine kinase/response regulator
MHNKVTDMSPTIPPPSPAPGSDASEDATANGDILIVDDDPANLFLLSNILTGQGYEVRSVRNGQMALTAARAAPPDLILLDITMPGMSGYQVCEHLKADEGTRDIPVIFISALHDTREKIKAFTVGGVDYITKPLQLQEVLARIETHLALRNLQKSLRQEIIERDKLIAELDAYAHTVAHDLKDPLSSLIGFSELLEKNYTEISDKELSCYVHTIAKNGRKMINIIEELLLLASVRKIEDVEMEPLDMAAIVAEAQRRLADMITKYQAEIISPPAWPVALGHGLWVEEVWINYLSNAIKYGGQPPRVELGATLPEEPDGQICFWARDNGPGLPPEDQARLFTPFTQIHQARTEGHGLGLSIVQRIAEKLGGQVGVQSEVGQGSLFFFTLGQAPGE